MFYITEIEDYVRVDPKLFGLETQEAIEQQLAETYKDHYDPEIGKVLSVIEILRIKKGVIISGDGAAYYDTSFKLLVWKPELQELILGEIEEVKNFGVLFNMGIMTGMIHVSQTMDDFVSVSKTDSLLGKKTKRSLKKGDSCVARIIAISHRGDFPKIALTMRQPGLGKIDWIKEDKMKKEKEAKKIAAKIEKGKKK